jgi:hypothetical protein
MTNAGRLTLLADISQARFRQDLDVFPSDHRVPGHQPLGLLPPPFEAMFAGKYEIEPLPGQCEGFRMQGFEAEDSGLGGDGRRHDDDVRYEIGQSMEQSWRMKGFSHQVPNRSLV